MLDVLFLTKPGDARAREAVQYLRRFADVHVFSGAWGSPLPDDARQWTGDVIISYLSRWIVPASLLARVPIAVNFHPAPPEYPGIGSTNWALYDGAKSFGVTCHIMAPKVDSGAILAIKRFPIHEDDDVASLSERAWDEMLALFFDVAGALVAGHTLAPLEVSWTGAKRTRAQLDELATITLGMSEAEALRRMRATNYKGYPPWLLVGEKKFQLQPADSGGK